MKKLFSIRLFLIAWAFIFALSCDNANNTSNGGSTNTSENPFIGTWTGITDAQYFGISEQVNVTFTNTTWQFFGTTSNRGRRGTYTYNGNVAYCIDTHETYDGSTWTSIPNTTSTLTLQGNTIIMDGLILTKQ